MGFIMSIFPLLGIEPGNFDIPTKPLATWARPQGWVSPISSPQIFFFLFVEIDYEAEHLQILLKDEP